jgi:hypothetical protein
MAASSRDQAGLLFNQAAGFVVRSPGFTDRFRVFEGYRRIKCLRTDGRLQVFAADDRTGDGVIPTLALIDEPHRARNLNLVRTWRGKLAKRGGQLGLLSTAGEPGTEFEDARAAALRTATDIRVDGFHTRAAGPYSVLHDWSVPDGADVNDMAVVKRANPLSTITEQALRRKRDSPTMTDVHWRRFACNQAVRGEESAITLAEWAALRRRSGSRTARRSGSASTLAGSTTRRRSSPSWSATTSIAVRGAGDHRSAAERPVDGAGHDQGRRSGGCLTGSTSARS